MAAPDHPKHSAQTIDRPQNPRRGIVLMIAGLAMFSIGEGAVKYLTTDYEIVQIVWARYTFHALLFLVIFSRIGLKRQIARSSTRSGSENRRASPSHSQLPQLASGRGAPG